MDHAASHCFAPAVTSGIRLLILGSLPGGQSLAKGQYYGHPQNQFWRLTGHLIDTDLVSLPYEDRLRILNSHDIGLWDVVAQAVRPGSLDQNMRNIRANALRDFIRQFTALEAIGFNGSTASRIGRRQLGPEPSNGSGEPLALVDLPSSSPAHTLAYDRKRQAWEALASHVGKSA